MCKSNYRGEIFFYDTVDSTQSAAKRLALDGAAHGTIAAAEEQTEGRGRRGRGWCSARGKGLYFSIVLRPEIPPRAAQLVSMAAGLAVARAIDGAGAPGRAEIKWPNDVLVDGAKICGIIAECASEPEKIRHAVVGIGVNISQSPDELPLGDDGRTRAASIAAALGIEPDKRVLMYSVATELLALVEELGRGETGKFLGEYRARCSTIGSWVRVITDERDYAGRALDVDEDGTLVVDCIGRIVRFAVADVVHVR